MFRTTSYDMVTNYSIGTQVAHGAWAMALPMAELMTHGSTYGNAAHGFLDVAPFQTHGKSWKIMVIIIMAFFDPFMVILGLNNIFKFLIVFFRSGLA